MGKPAADQNEFHIEAGKDGERRFVLHPENNDLFVQTGKQVITACRLSISLDVWLSEMNAMFEHVQNWATAHATMIRSCFFAPGGTKAMLFFMPKADQFDFDLADQLAILTPELVNRFNVGMVELRQIPWDEMDRFLDRQTAVHIYGDQPEPHPAVET